MKIKEYTFSYPSGETYVVNVTYKRQRGLYLRKKGDIFYATAPVLMSESKVKEFIYKSIPTLNKRIAKNKSSEAPKGEEYTYILGEKIDKVYDDKELKKIALDEFIKLTRECEQEMGITSPYKVTVRNMKTRYGSNSSKTHAIHYQLSLIHFSNEIIRSVVVHELAHDKYHNHQSGFYNHVLKYCPNYWELKKKLRKGIYK
ncbi:MAG: M48 family metallopeptidase [Bacilli bacterium]|nr:M48 family metallopeptidase [Bacilli bacterium]